MTATRDRRSDPEAGAGPAWDDRPIYGQFRGLPWWAAVVLALGVTVIAAFVDMQRQDSLGRIYQGAFVVGCVVAVCLVRRRSLFGPIVQPPLVFAITAIGAVVLLGPKTGGGGLKSLILSVALPLTSNFPTMGITTAVVVAIGVFRLWRERDPNPQVRPSKPAKARPAREDDVGLADEPGQSSGGRDPRETGQSSGGRDPREPGQGSGGRDQRVPGQGSGGRDPRGPGQGSGGRDPRERPSKDRAVAATPPRRGRPEPEGAPAEERADRRAPGRGPRPSPSRESGGRDAGRDSARDSKRRDAAGRGERGRGDQPPDAARGRGRGDEPPSARRREPGGDGGASREDRGAPRRDPGRDAGREGRGGTPGRQPRRRPPENYR